MKKEHNIRSKLNYEKVLFSFHFKKRFISIRTLVCMILSITPTFYILINIQAFIDPNTAIDQNFLDVAIFWSGFIGQKTMVSFFRMIPVIIAVDIISGEFSNKTAMILYSTVPRNRVLLTKIIFLISYMLFFVLFSFISFGIVFLFKFNLIVSINFLITGFSLIFIDFTFILSLTVIFSALNRNTIISFLIPLLYINVEPIFESLEMELLSYSYYKNNIYSFFERILFDYPVHIYGDTILTFIVFFSAPVIIFLITFYGFKQLDIRTN